MNSLKAMGANIVWFMMEFEELSVEEKHLFEVACDARRNAQAPYSNFHVGVAVQAEKTKSIYSGCNVERASWTQTSHAEQSAIDTMVRWEGPAKISKLALVAGPKDSSIFMPPKRTNQLIHKFNEISVPCGHCLQCIWENCHGDKNVQIFSILPNGLVGRITIENAFPLRFGPSDLGVNYVR